MGRCGATGSWRKRDVGPFLSPVQRAAPTQQRQRRQWRWCLCSSLFLSTAQSPPSLSFPEQDLAKEEERSSKKTGRKKRREERAGTRRRYSGRSPLRTTLGGSTMKGCPSRTLSTGTEFDSSARMPRVPAAINYRNHRERERTELGGGGGTGLDSAGPTVEVSLIKTQCLSLENVSDCPWFFVFSIFLVTWSFHPYAIYIRRMNYWIMLAKIYLFIYFCIIRYTEF